MARHRAHRSAQRSRPVSKQKDQGTHPRGVQIVQLRQSARLACILRPQKSKGRNPPSPLYKANLPSHHDPSSPLPVKSQKCLRDLEHQAHNIPSENPKKRLKTPPPRSIHRQTFHQKVASGLSESRWSHIRHWAQEGQVWPTDFFGGDMMNRALARKRSPSLITGSSMTPSDQRTRKEKSAPYRHARCELQLIECGIFMSRYKDGITNDSKNLCRELIETPRTHPEGTLWADDLFEGTFEMIRNRNEARVIRDIAQLLVPSAEVLAHRGAKNLSILIETVNEGWNNCVPLLGTRPQPDYGLGFRRRSFSKNQLQKLKPYIGEQGDLSLFAATHEMYLPFLTSEVKCGASELDIADRQNAHNMGVALIGLVELFRLVGREKELHCQVNGFSISHNDETARIYGYYPVINGTEVEIYRETIRRLNFQNRAEKWVVPSFIMNVYHMWSEPHFKRVCSVIDELPSRVGDFQNLAAAETGVSQQFSVDSKSNTSDN